MLPPKRIGRQLRASPVPGVLLCVFLATVSASMPATRKCHAIDCARVGRDLCQSGSSRCGPCLYPLEENKKGNCVAQKSPHHHGKMTTLPVLDEEIDFLQSIMDKQQVLEDEQAVTSSKPAPPLQTDVPRQRAGQSPHPPRPTTTTNPPATKLSTGAEGQKGPIAVPYPSTGGILVIMISLCIVLGTAAMILTAVCLVRFQRESRLARKVDYKAFNGKPPGTANSTSAEDKTLAQNAHMYHYQHQKQQMISMGKQKPEQEIPDSEVTTEDEEVGEDFTVYECPGLAPTGEMEVKNPLFDDSTLQYQRNHK